MFSSKVLSEPKNPKDEDQIPAMLREEGRWRLRKNRTGLADVCFEDNVKSKVVTCGKQKRTTSGANQLLQCYEDDTFQVQIQCSDPLEQNRPNMMVVESCSSFTFFGTEDSCLNICFISGAKLWSGSMSQREQGSTKSNAGNSSFGDKRSIQFCSQGHENTVHANNWAARAHTSFDDLWPRHWGST